MAPLAGSDETPLQRRWAILAAIVVLAVTFSVVLYYGPHITLSDTSFQGGIYLCFSVISVIMISEIVRKRTRTIVAYVGVLCLILFIPIYIISLVPGSFVVALSLIVSETLLYSLFSLYHALRKEQEKRPVDTAESKETDQQSIELDVNWHLSSDVQPVPPFGSQDMPGSDEASKLHVSQTNEEIILTGAMKCLKPLHMYQVELGPHYTAGRRIRSDNIAGSVVTFRTDEKGEYTWSHNTTVHHLKRHGIVDVFSVWVGDVPKNATVLLSDNIPIHDQ